MLHEPRHVPWVCALLCAHSGAAVDAARRDARGCAGPDGAAHGCASLTCSLATPLSSSRGRADTAMPNKDDAPLGAVLLCAPARERAAARPAQVPLHRRALPRLQTRHLPARADPHRYLSSTSASRLVALAQHTCAAPHCVQAELSVLPLSLDLGRLCYQSATVRAWQPLAASCKPAQTLSAHAYEFASGWVDLPHLSSQNLSYGAMQCKTVHLMQRRSSDGLVGSGLELPVACQTKLPSAGPLRAAGRVRLMAPAHA